MAFLKMSLSKEASIIAIFLCVAILKSASAITTLQRSHLYPSENHELFYDYQSFERTNLVYALCEKSKIPIKKCAVLSESYSFDKPAQTAFCNINLEFDRQDYAINRAVRLIQFGSDKAIFVWWEIARDTSKDAFAKISIVHFSSCKTHDIELAINGLNYTYDNNLPLATIFTTYNDTFDVIFPNKNLCNDNMCKITFDADGNTVNDLVMWAKASKFDKPPLTFVLPLSQTSPLFGNVVVEQHFSENKLDFFRYKNNHFQLLQSHKTNDMLSFKYSTANRKIGMCLSSVNKTIECSQFDSEGNPTLHKTLNFEYPSKKLSMHNTIDGGFLLLTSQNIDCYKDNCLDSFFNYNVTKYNASGHANGSLSLGGFHCPVNTITWAAFFENENDEYCVSFSCLHPYNVPINKKKNFLIFKTKCFLDKDLEREEIFNGFTVPIKKSRRFFDKQLFINSDSIDNSSLIYALCDPIKENSRKSCSIVLERYSFNDKPAQISSCDLTLDLNEKLLNPQKIELISLGEDKAIVAYGKWEDYISESTNVTVRFTTVHFSNCKTKENKITMHDKNRYYIERFASLFVVYEDTFNVVYRNPDLCNDKYCRETYDAEGNRISGPTGWLTDRPNTGVTILPIHDHSPLLGHAIVEKVPLALTEDQFTLSFSNNEGLKEIKSKSHYKITNWLASNVYNRIGICVNDLTAVCEQFDPDGNRKLNVTISTAADMQIYSMYNLPNGGFLLFTNGAMRCFIEKKLRCDYDPDENYVTKFDENGTMTNSIKLGKFNCKYDKVTKLFQKNDDEYCVSFTCARVMFPRSSNYQALFHFEANCFSIKDL